MMKRAFDIVVSALLLLVLSPLMAIVALGIKLSSRGPVLFRQERAGLRGRPFDLLKFRSMHVDPAASLETSSSDPRVFAWGRVMREYHLDELAQLWNVLKGDMSLVGPRPTLLSQVERYSPEERRRLDVRPGLTGLAQVSGNNLLDWDDRIKVDLEYVRKAGLFSDLKILWRTVFTVARKEGVYGPDGHVRDKR